MTDLSKQLGEIKRRSVDAERLFVNECKIEHNGDCIGDRARLLHIIEVEIPGMLRARAKELDKLPDGPYDDGRLQGGIDELCAAALFIESLTKDNEKENG